MFFPFTIPGQAPRRTKAFTLIEILLVTSLIVILAALLLPAATRVLDRSNTAKSIHNLREIGIATAGYVADHDGELPSKDFTDASRHWLVTLYERTYGKPWPNFVPFDTGENLRGTIFFSPALKRDEPKPWRSYGWNNYLQATGGPPPKAVAISRPSEVILCGEGMNRSSLYTDSVSTRNQGKALLMMADFHVESVNKENVSTNASDPMWRPAQ